MSDFDALLQAVCDNLADDTPRLVFADWFEDRGEPERAEFIRLQVAAARRFGLDPTGPPDPDLERAAELERLYGERWPLGTPPAAYGVTLAMWRGFPFRVAAPDRRSLARVEHSPPGLRAVEYLTLGEVTRGAVDYFAARWYTPRVGVLEVRGGVRWSFPGFFRAGWSSVTVLLLRGADMGSIGTAAVVNAGLPSLRILDLGAAEVENGGVAALCRPGVLTDVVRIHLDGNWFTEHVHADLRAKFGERLTF